MAFIQNLSDKKKIAIGRLLKDADSISLKVLTVFDSTKDADVNESKLAKMTRPELDALATYLKVPLVTKVSQRKLFSSRGKLAKRIVQEITSLYPAICAECTEEYTVMPGKQPKTRCWICLKGAHDCEGFTANMELYQSQPHQLQGMVWLCSHCTAEKRCIGENDEPPPGAITPGHTEVRSRSDSKTETPNAQNIELQKLAEKLEKAKEDQDNSESKPNACKHVCPRLIEGTCPHGISGKKAADGKEKCDLYHPKRCIKYLRFRTHETRGCKDGENCAFFHVNHCQASVESKKCMDVNCKLMHLAGTKRPKSMLKKRESGNNVTKSKQSADAPRRQVQVQETKNDGSKPVHKGTKAAQKSKNQQKGAPRESTFLGMQSLLDEFKELKTTLLGEITSLKTGMDLQKIQIEALMKSNVHPVLEQRAPQYGLFKPTPYGTQQWQHLCQQRMGKYPEPAQSQPMNYQPNMTPIHPACC